MGRVAVGTNAPRWLLRAARSASRPWALAWAREAVSGPRFRTDCSWRPGRWPRRTRETSELQDGSLPAAGSLAATDMRNLRASAFLAHARIQGVGPRSASVVGSVAPRHQSVSMAPSGWKNGLPALGPRLREGSGVDYGVDVSESCVIVIRRPLEPWSFDPETVSGMATHTVMVDRFAGPFVRGGDRTASLCSLARVVTFYGEFRSRILRRGCQQMPSSPILCGDKDYDTNAEQWKVEEVGAMPSISPKEGLPARKAGFLDVALA